MRRLTKLIHLPLETLKTVALLFALFALILGVSSFVFTPVGLTYEANPIINIIWLIFGFILVEKFTPLSTKSVTFSKYGIIVVICLILAGLASSMPSANLIARSVKIIEIIFQDLVIAVMLVTLLKQLSDKKVQIWLSISFAALHVPLFITEQTLRAGIIVLGALLISYVSIKWFAQKGHDITAILVPHILFYLVFGTAFSIIFW